MYLEAGPELEPPWIALRRSRAALGLFSQVSCPGGGCMNGYAHLGGPEAAPANELAPTGAVATADVADVA